MLVHAARTAVCVKALLGVHREALNVQLSNDREDLFLQRVLDVRVVGHLLAFVELHACGQIRPRRILLHRLLFSTQSSDTS